MTEASVAQGPAPRDGIAGWLPGPVVWVAAFASVAAVLLLRHVWASPGNRIVAGNPNDFALSAWFLRHTAWSVLHLHNPLLFNTMNAPAGINGMWNSSILLAGLVMTPLTLLAGQVIALNVLLTASFVLSTVSAFVLIKRFVANDVAAGVGAFVYGFSPAVLAASIGHMQIAMDFLAPVILLLVHQAVVGRRGPVLVGAMLGLAMAAQLLLGEEILFMTALASGIGLVIAALNAPRSVRERLPRLIQIGVVALLVFAMLDAYPLWLQFFGPLHQHGSPFVNAYFEADLKGFVVPSSRYWIATSSQQSFAAAYGGGAPEYMAYLGWPVVLLLVGIAVWRIRDVRVRVLFLTAAVLALASLGGILHFGEHEYGLHLPWGLVWHLPVLDTALPNRFAILIALAAAIVLAVGLEAVFQLRDIWARVVGVIATLTVIVALLPKPYATDAVPGVPSFFHHAQTVIAQGSTILVLPFPSPTQTDALYWQAAANMRFEMPGGIFIGPDATGQAYVYGPGPRATAQLLMGIEQSGQAPPVTPAVRAEVAADLEYWRADGIVLGPTPGRASLVAFLTTVLHQSPRSTGGVYLWELRRSPAS